MNIQYLEAIKKSEGFTAKAQWDYAQYSNGYGTKAKYPGEVIDRLEADRRFASEIANAKAAVDAFAPGLDEGTTAALTSLTYNAGTNWMRAGLGAAIKEGDLEAAKRVFVQYVHAGGQRLAGLEARRAVEVQWIGQSQSAISTGVPDAEGSDGIWGTVDVRRNETPMTFAFASGDAPRVESTLRDDGHLRASEAIGAIACDFLVEVIAIAFAARAVRQNGDDRDPEPARRIGMVPDPDGSS